MLSVNDFVKDQVPVGVVGEIGRPKELLKVAAMVMHVPRDPDLPFRGQMHNLPDPHRVDLVLLGCSLEHFDHLRGG